MKKVIGCVLAGALVAVSGPGPVFAEEAGYLVRAPHVTAAPVVSVRDAAKLTVAATLARSARDEASGSGANAPAFGPRSMPRGNGGARHQANAGGGGGKTMMIVSLVTTVAGAAGGYLIYKEMKKDSNKSTQ